MYQLQDIPPDTNIQSKPLRTKKKETIDLTHCFETLVHLRVLRIK